MAEEPKSGVSQASSQTTVETGTEQGEEKGFWWQLTFEQKKGGDQRYQFSRVEVTLGGHSDKLPEAQQQLDGAGTFAVMKIRDKLKALMENV